MSDSIDRQKVLVTLDFADNALTDEERTVEKYKELLAECIKMLPSVENKGKWIKVDLKGYTEYLWECNKCEAHHRAMYDFCPSCGTDMRGE